MKFAFIIMGNYDVNVDRSQIQHGATKMIGVANLDEACKVAKELYLAGVDCIELCGAFGEVGAKRIIEATENKIPVGYVTHLAMQDELYKQVFPND